MTMNRMKKRLLFAGAAITAAMCGMPAAAQEAETTSVGEIVVTGSRIKRQDISGVGPATVVTGEDIERTGITNVEALLQRLPSSAGAAGNQTNSYWTGNGYGTAQVNLRGLGINRTLTLINGRRIVNGGTGANSAPDLNMIPTAIIGRMDVLKDGASAIYGADAVAGVVNIVTINDFEGLKLSSKYGVTDEGDGQDLSFDLLWGMRGDRGGVTAALTYQKTEAVNLASRAPCGLGEIDGKLACVASATTLGGRAVLPNGQQINFNQIPGGDGDFFEPYNGTASLLPGDRHLSVRRRRPGRHRRRLDLGSRRQLGSQHRRRRDDQYRQPAAGGRNPEHRRLQQRGGRGHTLRRLSGRRRSQPGGSGLYPLHLARHRGQRAAQLDARRHRHRAPAPGRPARRGRWSRLP